MGQEPLTRRIQHQGIELELVIKRARRKTLALHVMSGTGKIEVRAPMKCAWTEINGFIDAKLDWLVDAVEHLRELPAPPSFQHGTKVSYLGDWYEIETHLSNRNLTYLEGKRLCFASRQSASLEQNERRYHSFLRAEGEKLFPVRLQACVEKFPLLVEPERLRIRRMKARWGSCSVSGEICLNSMLMQKPVRAIDLVIIHELCHLVHFQHDSQFYSLMDQAMPDWRQAEALLSAQPLGDVDKGPDHCVEPRQISLF